MSQFTLPRDIYFGRGSLSHLKDLQGKKAFIVTDGQEYPQEALHAAFWFLR